MELIQFLMKGSTACQQRETSILCVSIPKVTSIPVIKAWVNVPNIIPQTPFYDAFSSLKRQYFASVPISIPIIEVWVLRLKYNLNAFLLCN